jgi:RNA polymerase sigma-70 factor (ECF subfamily)
MTSLVIAQLTHFTTLPKRCGASRKRQYGRGNAPVRFHRYGVVEKYGIRRIAIGTGALGQSTTKTPETSTTSADLIDLMQCVARRDGDAFKALYNATSGKAFGVITRILGRQGSAEEALQDVYVKIWERAADFDPARGSAIGWIATIARNRALDEVRRTKKSGVVDVPEGFEPAAPTEHPLDRRERSEALRKLMGCLAGLEEEKRQIILLAYYKGMSREALAERFKHPVPTIKTWLHRGLAQLKVCLSS